MVATGTSTDMRGASHGGGSREGTRRIHLQPKPHPARWDARIQRRHWLVMLLLGQKRIFPAWDGGEKAVGDGGDGGPPQPLLPMKKLKKNYQKKKKHCEHIFFQLPARVAEQEVVGMGEMQDLGWPLQWVGWTPWSGTSRTHGVGREAASQRVTCRTGLEVGSGGFTSPSSSSQTPRS